MWSSNDNQSLGHDKLNKQSAKLGGWKGYRSNIPVTRHGNDFLRVKDRYLILHPTANLLTLQPAGRQVTLARVRLRDTVRCCTVRQLAVVWLRTFIYVGAFSYAVLMTVFELCASIIYVTFWTRGKHRSSLPTISELRKRRSSLPTFSESIER